MEATTSTAARSQRVQCRDSEYQGDSERTPGHPEPALAMAGRVGLDAEQGEQSGGRRHRHVCTAGGGSDRVAGPFSEKPDSGAEMVTGDP